MGAFNFSSFPPGFGFRPTDAELIDYLKNKILGKKIESEVIPLVEIYKHEPWELPAQCNVPTRDAKWHFFANGHKKYPNGTRKNRATRAGYWKTTGKDRKIRHHNRNVGTKKTLVFHEGRPPVGKRTDWIMHEFYVNEKEFMFTPEMKDSYVLCRVTHRGTWEPMHGSTSNSVNAPSISVDVSSKSVESEEELNAWIKELFDPDVTGSPTLSVLNSVETEGNGTILDANQETVDSQFTPEIYEDLDQLFPIEEYLSILESENENTVIFKDFDIDTDIFIDQQDDIFNLTDIQEFAPSNHDDDNNNEWAGIQIRQREAVPSSFNATTSTTKFKLQANKMEKIQANKMEKISNREPLSEFFDVESTVCLGSVCSLRVISEAMVKSTAYKSRQSTFVNCFFLCAFITAVFAFVCYFKMRNARSFVTLGLL